MGHYRRILRESLISLKAMFQELLFRQGFIETGQKEHIVKAYMWKGGMMQNRTRWLLVLMVLSLALMFNACANGKVRSQKQQATIWMETYNQQYDDTMAVMTNPGSTDIQKEIGRKKKLILTQVWPSLQIYADIVDKGLTPTPELTNNILQLMTQLNDLIILSKGGK